MINFLNKILGGNILDSSDKREVENMKWQMITSPNAMMVMRQLTKAKKVNSESSEASKKYQIGEKE